MSARYATLSSFAATAASALVGAFLVLHPASASFATPSGIHVTGWFSVAARTCFWPLLLLLAALGATGHALVGRVARERNGLPGAALRVLRPLLLGPSLVWAGFGAEWLGMALASLFIPYGSVFIAALMVDALYGEVRASLPRLSALRIPPKGAWALLGAAYAVVMALAVSYLRPEFDGGGDVIHYQTMAENLVRSGSLDLTETFETIARAHGVSPQDRASRAGLLAKCHMKENAKGRIYSYHSFGFPLFVALFQRLFGKASKWMVLTLLSILGAGGCLAATRAAGASRTDTLFVIGLTVLSAGWILTSGSFLPEMAGVALTAWGFWAVMARGGRGRRVAATAVAALCCACLPYAHVRFAPIALLLAAFFGLEGLLRTDEPFWREKVPRLALFALVCLAAWACLYLCHRTMFSPPPPVPPAAGAVVAGKARAAAATAGAYNYRRVFFAYPLAMWGMFADRRGLVSLVPALWFLAVSPLAVALRGRRQARWALYGILTSAAILLACCTTRVSLSGACLNGRYFFQAVPLLLPFAALLLPRLPRVGRLWLFFLLLLPVATLLCACACFSTTDLVRTPAQIWKIPSFANLYQPLVSCLETEDALARLCGFAFAGCMILASALFACIRRARLAVPLAIGVLAAGLAAGFVSDARGHVFSEHALWLFAAGGDYARFHADRPSKGTYFDNMVAPAPEGENGIILFADGPAKPRHPHDQTFNLSKPYRRRLLAFAGRRWYSLRPSDFKLQAEVAAAVRVSGRVARGTARLLAYRTAFGDSEPIGAEHVVGEGRFRERFVFPSRRERAKYNVFLSMDDDIGEAVVDEVLLAPYVPGLESVLGPLD